MVVNVGRGLVAAVIVVLIALLLLSVFAPTVVDGDGEDSAAMFVSAALWAYKDENGHAPENLVSIQSFLRESTRWTCSITEARADHYHVEMSGKYRTYYLDVEYRVNTRGEIEKYHVASIRSNRGGERIRDRRQ